MAPVRLPSNLHLGVIVMPLPVEAMEVIERVHSRVVLGEMAFRVPEFDLNLLEEVARERHRHAPADGEIVS